MRKIVSVKSVITAGVKRLRVSEKFLASVDKEARDNYKKHVQEFTRRCDKLDLPRKDDIKKVKKSLAMIDCSDDFQLSTKQDVDQALLNSLEQFVSENLSIEALYFYVNLLSKEGVEDSSDCFDEQLYACASKYFSKKIDNIDALKSQVSQLRYKTLSHQIEQGLSSMFGQMLSGAPLSIKPLLELNCLPEADLFTSYSKKILTTLYQTLIPNGQLKNIEDQWTSLIAASSGLQPTNRLIKEMFPQGVTGEALDSKINRIKDKETKDLLNTLVKGIRDRKGPGDNTRLEQAEKRIEGIVTSIKLKVKDKDKINTTLKHFVDNLEDTCETGIDLQLYDCHQEIRGTKSNKSYVLTWLNQTIQQVLVSVCGLDQAFVSDVHHINAVLKLLWEEDVEPMPTALQDSYRPAFKEKIDLYASQIKDAINQSVFQLIRDKQMQSKLVDRERGTYTATIESDLKILNRTGFVKHNDVVFCQDQVIELVRHKVRVSTITELERLLEVTMTQDAQKTLESVVSKGILGIAAREGREDVYDHFSDLITHKDDITSTQCGLSLFEEAVLGGNTNIIEKLIYSYDDEDGLRKILANTHHESMPDFPSPLSLAAESGNLEVFQEIRGCYDGVDYTKLDMKGESILSRAVMGGNRNVVKQILSEGDNLRALLKHRNGHGQTLFHLCINYGHQDLFMDLLSKCFWLKDEANEFFTQETEACVSVLKFCLYHHDKFYIERLFRTNKVKLEEELEVAEHLALYQAGILAEYLFLNPETKFQILMIEDADEDADSILQILARDHFEILKEVLLGIENEEELKAILKFQDATLFQLLGFLSENQPETFFKLVKGKSQEFYVWMHNEDADGILTNVYLNIPDDKWDEFYRYCIYPLDEDKLLEILNINEQGALFALVLLDNASDHFAEMLTGMSKKGRFDVFCLLINEEKPLLIYIYENYPEYFREIIKRDAEFLEEILTMPTPEEPLGADMIKTMPNTFMELVRLNKETFFKCIDIEDWEGESLLSLIATHHMEGFKEICQYPVMVAGRSVPLIHWLAENNPVEIEKVLENHHVLMPMLLFEDEHKRTVLSKMVESDWVGLSGVLKLYLGISPETTLSLLKSQLTPATTFAQWLQENSPEFLKQFIANHPAYEVQVAAITS